MRNDCSSFSNAASRSASALLSVWLLLVSGPLVRAATETPRPLPEAPVAEVNRNANGNRYQIGDRITLEARIPSGLLEAGDSVQISGEDGKESPQWLIDPHPEWVQGIVRFIVAPVQTGELDLPKLRISREGTGPIALTGPYRISVSGPAAEPGKTPELFPVIGISLSWMHRILLALLLLSIGGVAYLAFKRLRNRKQPLQSPEVPAPLRETPDEIAVRKIELLFRENPFSRAALKPVCFGSSEILKDFFSARFSVDASESTTREMMALLSGAGMARDSLREVEALFATLDLVKFTREENFAHLNEVDYSSLRSSALLIIARWRTLPAPAPAAGGDRE